MSYSKRQFVNSAFGEMGMGSYEFDLSPEHLNMALWKLDAMMAEWNAKGIRLSYPMSSSPENSSLDTETNVPDSANETITTNLAIRISPAFGKTVSRETKTTAKQGYNTLLSRATMPNEMQFPSTLPRGSGNKTWETNNNTFFNEPVDNVNVGGDGDLELY